MSGLRAKFCIYFCYLILKSSCLQKKIHLADMNFRTIDQEGHAKGMRVGGLFHGKINGRGRCKLGKDGFA